jgi:fumarate hydratase class II
VIAEAVNMVAAQIIGYDAAIAIAAMNGNLDLNVMMPVIAHDLLESIELTASASRVLAEKCVRGIKANVERCREYAELTGQLVTAVAPVIGYDKAAAVYKKAVARNTSIRQVLLDEKLLPAEKLDEILDLKKLTRGGRA